jgi:bifunctional non-homologous end joining protein LigD
MSQQLSLPLDGGTVEAGTRLPERLAPPLASDGGTPFDDAARWFEPWWPGAHALLRIEGGRMAIRTEHLSDPLHAFPELAGVTDLLAGDGLIIEGSLLALDAEGRPDAGLLRRRLAGSSSREDVGEGAFVATDLPYLEGRSLKRLAFARRREQLLDVLTDGDHGVVSRGLIGEGVTMGHAVAALGLHAISARRLEATWRSGPAGEDWLRIPVTDTPAEPTRPFMVLLEKLPLGD